jgi:hypothetical protein
MDGKWNGETCIIASCGFEAGFVEDTRDDMDPREDGLVLMPLLEEGLLPAPLLPPFPSVNNNISLSIIGLTRTNTRILPLN